MYFYLPIYKETEEQFEKRYEKNFAKRISELEAQSGNVISQRMQMRIKDQLAKDMGRSWQQNQAVGWIRVGKGKGGFTFIISKSNPERPRGPKRYFDRIPPDECYGGYHVISFETCTNSAEVLDLFKRIFSEIVEDSPFKGCFVDDSQIVNLADFIDWKALIDK
ncbi:hypothetical protein VCSRO12_3545 [Vibrio cholerae]|nr:hypothetical protein [Vibrio cholerae]EGQ9325849.1 hypothetical protein [Vibrio cholerae]EGR0162044.1 hypothetical protein [Vibrio cholerae]EGR0522037.1 hypothetical protein [Vibrio cholerae]EGR0608783.1 hypothetical protein [Vibrio cholerae]EGR2123997.1 hypothetical protein [Vibrio cholerae]